MRIKNKHILFLITLLFLSVNVFSQTTVKNSLLWEISGKGLSQPSYLFGTYHFAGKSFLDTLPNVLRCLYDANKVVGEIVMEDEMTMAQKLMPLMILNDNSLDNILSQQEYAETDSLLKAKTPLRLNMLNALKPAAVQMTLISFILPKDISAENPALDIPEGGEKSKQTGSRFRNSRRTGRSSVKQPHRAAKRTSFKNSEGK